MDSIGLNVKEELGAEIANGDIAMDERKENLTILHVGTVDGIFTFTLEGEAKGRLFSASLRASPVWAIAVDPEDPSVLLAGCGGRAGLFMSRDGGLTWEATGIWLRDREVWAVAFRPRDPRVVFAGTQPAAIYRSQDRGYTWEELGSVRAVGGQQAWTFPVPPHEAHVRHVACDPARPERVLAAVEVGGILYSEDGGDTWRNVGRQVNADVHSVLFWPGRADVALAATGGGLFRGDLRTWTRVGEGAVGDYIISLRTARQEPWDLYATGRGGSTPIYRSKDGGLTWQGLGNNLPRPGLGVDSLALHPHEPGRLFYGADDPQAPGLGCIFVSRDSGHTWQKMELDVPLPPITRVRVCQGRDVG